MEWRVVGRREDGVVERRKVGVVGRLKVGVVGRLKVGVVMREAGSTGRGLGIVRRVLSNHPWPAFVGAWTRVKSALLGERERTRVVSCSSHVSALLEVWSADHNTSRAAAHFRDVISTRPRRSAMGSATGAFYRMYQNLSDS